MTTYSLTKISLAIIVVTACSVTASQEIDRGESSSVQAAEVKEAGNLDKKISEQEILEIEERVKKALEQFAAMDKPKEKSAANNAVSKQDRLKAIEDDLKKLMANKSFRGSLLGGTLSAAATAHPAGLILGGIAGALVGRSDDDSPSSDADIFNNQLHVEQYIVDADGVKRQVANIDDCSGAYIPVDVSPEAAGSSQGFTKVSANFGSGGESKSTSQPRRFMPHCFYYSD